MIATVVNKSTSTEIKFNDNNIKLGKFHNDINVVKDVIADMDKDGKRGVVDIFVQRGVNEGTTGKYVLTFTEYGYNGPISQNNILLNIDKKGNDTTCYIYDQELSDKELNGKKLKVSATTKEVNLKDENGDIDITFNLEPITKEKTNNLNLLQKFYNFIGAACINLGAVSSGISVVWALISMLTSKDDDFNRSRL